MSDPVEFMMPLPMPNLVIAQRHLEEILDDYLKQHPEMNRVNLKITATINLRRGESVVLTQRGFDNE
jgi:hypothetical protein